jgi:hypothetical protein
MIAKTKTWLPALKTVPVTLEYLDQKNSKHAWTNRAASLKG